LYRPSDLGDDEGYPRKIGGGPYTTSWDCCSLEGMIQEQEIFFIHQLKPLQLNTPPAPAPAPAPPRLLVLLFQLSNQLFSCEFMYYELFPRRELMRVLPLREMASEDCVLSLGSSDPNYRTKQMASDDALDPGSRVSR
jgi:hypothetical protein